MTPKEQADIRTELAATRQELKLETVAVRTDLRGEMKELRGEMKGLRGEMDEFRAELRAEMGEMRTEVRRQGVLMEALQVSLRQLAEGFVSIQDRMKSHQEDTARELAEIKSLLRTSFSDLDGRVSRLEHQFPT